MKKLLLISVIGLAVFVVGSTTSAVTNLVVNGDFEFPEVTNSSKWQIFPSGSVPGWTTEWAGTYAGAPAIANLELHEGVLMPAYSGDQSVEMDTDWSPANGEKASIKIYQDIQTCVGPTYTLKYAWSPRPGHSNNAIEVYWGGNLVGNHSGSTSGWTLTTVSSLTASGNTTQLKFIETATPDSLGMFLDAVSVEQVGECDGDGDGSPTNLDCNDNDATIYPGATDAVCNGVDNDCDIAIDEDYVSLPTTCGVGQCAATGTTSCVGGQVIDSCTAGTPTIEICNGLDDDCDGLVDEDLTQLTSNQYGLCSGNTETCVAGTWITDETNYVPVAEICDGLDNNCDGLIDEGGVCDSDVDGILDSEDICLVTTTDEPSEGLGTNRWIWDGDTWVKGAIPGKGKAKGPDFSVSMEQTSGCSCSQILDWLNGNYPEEYGEMNGHYKFGCSKSIIEDFISLVE